MANILNVATDLLVIAFLLNSFNLIHAFCETSEPKDLSYSAESVVFNGSIKDCSCSPTNICVRKCCALNYILVNSTCTYNNSVEFKINVHESTEVIINDSLGFRYIPGMMNCAQTNGYYRLEPDSFPEDAFFLQTDGRLWQPDTKTFIDSDQYCLEYFDDIGISALTCFPKSFKMVKRINALGMIISMPFLLATFLVYAFLPERNIHGKCLMCYVLSLFGAYLLLVIIQTHPNDISDASCITCGIFCLFFFMVSFFWMNVISIDTWWTFSGIRGFSGSKRATERKRFLLYSIYAFGVPLLIVILVSCFNAISAPETWYHPGIGDGQCWFSQGVPTLLYFYGPLTILIVINVTLFAKTALKIRQVQQDTAMLRTDDNKRHSHENDKQRFNLYLKLLLAMGVNWSMEIVSWLVDWQVGSVPPLVWILTDLCNALYGVFIFFIFVFKWNIWNLLKRRYYMMVGKVHLANSITRSSDSRATTTTSLCGR